MTDKPDDGGFAFPNLVKVTQHDPNTYSWEPIASGGMTLRQWYAGLAMQGIMAACPDNQATLPENVAKNSIKQADALIEELKK